MNSYYTHKHIFYIDSHRRESGTNNNFTYRLDNIDPDIEYDSVVVLDASIPKSNYIIDESNNIFVVSDPIPRDIILPIGNYNRVGFAKVLLGLLGEKYTINYDNMNRGEDSGKYHFTCTEASIFTFGSNRLYEIMGFNINSTNVFTLDGLYKITSTNIVNFRPEGTFYILSDICQNHNNSILQNIISASASDYNYITFHNPNPNEYSKDFSKIRSNVYTFKITNESFQDVFLNGINVVFTLMLFKRNNIGNLIKGFIKLKSLEK